ncbi:MAG: hypothetical protein O7F71_10525 [Gammaproteobacteria bacterium]|nr:hypothetical protein [Gammaproteobacteria bacterium]
MEDVFIFFGIVMAMSLPFLIAGFVREYFKYRREVGLQLTEVRKEIAHLNNDELREQLEGQQERIETLEAIVTDTKYELEKNISKLR